MVTIKKIIAIILLLILGTNSAVSISLFNISNEANSHDSYLHCKSTTMSSIDNTLTYEIKTIVYTGDKLGITQEVSGYRVNFYFKECGNGSHYIHFYNIQFADTTDSIETLQWHHIDGLNEFIIYVKDYQDLILNKSNALNLLSHDSLESYNIYVTLMDVLMYENFKDTSLDELAIKNITSYIIPRYQIKLPDWYPIITDIRFDVGDTQLSYIISPNNKNDNHIFYYKTDDTFLNQFINYEGFSMPSMGTSRYMGFIYVDENNSISYATLSEYCIVDVKLFNFINLYSFERREQIIKIINEE